MTKPLVEIVKRKLKLKLGAGGGADSFADSHIRGMRDENARLLEHPAFKGLLDVVDACVKLRGLESPGAYVDKDFDDLDAALKALKEAVER